MGGSGVYALAAPADCYLTPQEAQAACDAVNIP
jgi:hypothetical protein